MHNFPDILKFHEMELEMENCRLLGLRITTVFSKYIWLLGLLHDQKIEIHYHYSNIQDMSKII